VSTASGSGAGAVGRQIRFFNFPADVAALEAFVLNGNQSTIIRGTPPSGVYEDPPNALTLRDVGP
jgi:hypothetical protein